MTCQDAAHLIRHECNRYQVEIVFVIVLLRSGAVNVCEKRVSEKEALYFKRRAERVWLVD